MEAALYFSGLFLLLLLWTLLITWQEMQHSLPE